MASFRSASTYAPSVATTGHAVSTPSGFQAGDLLIVALMNPVVASITPPAGWTEVVDVTPSPWEGKYLAWKIADGTEGSSQTFTSTASGRPAGGMFAFSHVNGAAPVNASSGLSQGTGTDYTTASITPTVDNCLIAAFFYGYKVSAGTLSFTPDASFTERADIPNTNNGAALELQTKSQTTAASVNGSATSSTSSDDRYSVIVAIATAIIAVPFIAAASLVYAPTVAASSAVSVTAPFIASATAVYAPTLPSSTEVDAPFISAATTVYAPTIAASGTAAATVPFIASITVVHAPTLVTPPLYVASITAQGSSVFLHYNAPLDESVVPATSDYEVTVNGSAATVSDVFVVGNQVVLALSSAVADGATVTVAYTQGTDKLQDTDSDLAPSFTATAYTVRLLVTPAGVSIAFTDDILAAAPTWTRLDDTDNLVASFSIDRGRSFELDRTDVGRATVVINDTEGVLDPTNSSGTYYGLIEPLLPIALSLYNPVAETWSMIYRGFIEDLEYQEDPSQQVNFLTISCVDAFEILTAIEMQPGQFGDTPPDQSAGNVFFEDGPVDVRMIQVLGADNAHWDPAQTIIFTGNVDVYETVYSPGENVLQVLQDAADAEFPGLGNVYVSRDGKVTFHGRFAKFDPSGVSGHAGDAWPWNHWKAGDGTAVAASSSDTAQIRQLAFNRGLSKVINSALASPKDIAAGDIAGQLVTDDTSIGKYGIRSWSAESLLTKSGTTTGNDANDETKLFATYYVDNYAEPRNRISQLGFRSMEPGDDRASANWALLCGAEISDQIDVTVTHPGGGGFNLEPFFIEGIHYDVRPANGDYADVTLTLDVSPQAYFTTNPFD